MNVNKIKTTATLSFLFLIIILSYIRLYYGVDFTDEAFYVSLPYRFVLGDHPIVNEYSMYQFAGTLTYPFLKIFTLLEGNNDGVMLYTRHLFFITCFLTGSYVCHTLKKYLDIQKALLIGSFSLLYIPFNIFGLSYNTIAMITFTIGSFATFNYVQSEEKCLKVLTLTGLFYSLAVYVYPSFFVPVVLTTILLFIKEDYKKVVPGLFLGLLPIACLFFILLLQASFNIENLINYLQQTGYTDKSASQLATLLSAWIKTVPHFFLLGFLLLLAGILNWLEKKRFSYLILLICPFLLLGLFLIKYFQSKNPLMWYYLLINFSFLAPLYFPFTQKKYSQNLLLFVWLPSLIAGFATSLTSANVFINFIIGLLPAFLVSMIFIMEGLEYLGSKFNYKLITPILFLTTMIVSLLVYKFCYIYRDASFAALNYKVTSGPYKGLYTSRHQWILTEVINHDIKNIMEVYKPKSMLVYPSFSGVYLFSRLKPQTNSVWLFAKFNNTLTLDYFNSTGEKPELAIIFKPYLTKLNDVLVHEITSNDYEEILDRKLYTIYFLRHEPQKSEL